MLARNVTASYPTAAAIAIVLSVAVSVRVAADNVAIKLATVVPENSVWDKNLRQMGAEWTQATGGRISLTVFAGGSQGDEPTVLRKMRLDALQAASLTGVGLGTIDASFNVFDIPFFFESYDELNAVTDTKRPVQTVDDLKKIRMYTSAGNDRMVQWFKANGFEPRAMAMTDIMTGLSTGMIEGLPTPPLAAMLFQWYRQTPYMLDIGLAPVVGATVVTQKTWNAIAEADKPKLLAAAAGVQKRLQDDVPKQDALAVTEMTRRGLTVTKASSADWRAQADALAKTMRGEMVPPDIFDLAVKERDAFRKQHQPGSAR